MAVSVKINEGRNYITENEIIRVTGPLEKTIITAILDTGASLEEIKEASDWLEENRHIHATADRMMEERTRRVYEILDYAR